MFIRAKFKILSELKNNPFYLVIKTVYSNEGLSTLVPDAKQGRKKKAIQQKYSFLKVVGTMRNSSCRTQ